MKAAHVVENGKVRERCMHRKITCRATKVFSEICLFTV
jgi:hypothetical protein